MSHLDRVPSRPRPITTVFHQRCTASFFLQVAAAVASPSLSSSSAAGPAKPRARGEWRTVRNDAIGDVTGRAEVGLAIQDQRDQTFEFALAEKPSRVLVDPARNNLARYD